MVTEHFINESDYSDLDIEKAVATLSKAIGCQTISDPEDYAEFERMQQLMRQAYPAIMKAGTFELVGHSVLITISGKNPSLSPVLFMAHQDVVPVVEGTEKDWIFPPFSGEVAEGYIWGRGSLDIKQQVFGTLEAAEYLLRHGHSFERTVYFAFGEDEETFNTGSRAISDTLKKRGVRLSFLIDEGGGTISDGSCYGAEGVQLIYVDLMEKGYCDIELSVRSAGGHSSRPYGGSSLGKLACAIANVVNSPFPAALPTPLRATLAALRPYIALSPLKELIEDIDGNAEAIAAYCLEQRELFPYVCTTIAPTVIRGSSTACNVLPQDMSAVINFRIAQGHTAHDVMEHCKRVINDPEVSLRFLQANDPSAVARLDNEGYPALVQAMGHYYKNVVFAPSMTVGATDARSYEQICDTCLRCSPFLSEPELASSGVHGTNERLSVRSYAQGIRVLIRLMAENC